MQLFDNRVARSGDRQHAQTDHQGAEQAVQRGHKSRAHSFHGVLQFLHHVGKDRRWIDVGVAGASQRAEHRTEVLQGAEQADKRTHQPQTDE
jgi:hypothetical protein